MVTPSHTNVWLEILQRRPIVAFFWISTNAPILVSSPMEQPYRLMNFPSLTPVPSTTSGVTAECSFISARASAGDDRSRRGEQDFDVGPERARFRITKIEANHFVERRPAAA